jgi:hypothetical protein
MGMSRLPELRRDQLSAAGQAVWDLLVETRGGHVVTGEGSLRGPFNAFARAPLRVPLAARVRSVLDQEHEQVRLWETDDSRMGIESNLARWLPPVPSPSPSGRTGHAPESAPRRQSPYRVGGARLAKPLREQQQAGPLTRRTGAPGSR